MPGICAREGEHSGAAEDVPSAAGGGSAYGSSQLQVRLSAKGAGPHTTAAASSFSDLLLCAHSRAPAAGGRDSPPPPTAQAHALKVPTVTASAGSSRPPPGPTRATPRAPAARSQVRHRPHQPGPDARLTRRLAPSAPAAGRVLRPPVGAPTPVPSRGSAAEPGNRAGIVAEQGDRSVS